MCTFTFGIYESFQRNRVIEAYHTATHLSKQKTGVCRHGLQVLGLRLDLPIFYILCIFFHVSCILFHIPINLPLALAKEKLKGTECEEFTLGAQKLSRTNRLFRGNPLD